MLAAGAGMSQAVSAVQPAAALDQEQRMADEAHSSFLDLLAERHVGGWLLAIRLMRIEALPHLNRPVRFYLTSWGAAGAYF